eukprot:9490715-Pyramimonas_sp.AAC.1
MPASSLRGQQLLGGLELLLALESLLSSLLEPLLDSIHGLMRRRPTGEGARAQLGAAGEAGGKAPINRAAGRAGACEGPQRPRVA